MTTTILLTKLVELPDEKKCNTIKVIISVLKDIVHDENMKEKQLDDLFNIDDDLT